MAEDMKVPAFLGEHDKLTRRAAKVRAGLPPAAELLELMDAGWTYDQLAARFDCSRSTVAERMQRSGLLERRRAAAKADLAALPRRDDRAWEDRALCAETDPEAFFPEKGGPTARAKRVCAECEVRLQCLEYALANNERHGVWGGLSDRERERLKRERRAAS